MKIFKNIGRVLLIVLALPLILIISTVSLIQYPIAKLLVKYLDLINKGDNKDVNKYIKNNIKSTNKTTKVTNKDK